MAGDLPDKAQCTIWQLSAPSVYRVKAHLQSQLVDLIQAACSCGPPAASVQVTRCKHM